MGRFGKEVLCGIGIRCVTANPGTAALPAVHGSMMFDSVMGLS